MLLENGEAPGTPSHVCAMQSCPPCPPPPPPSRARFVPSDSLRVAHDQRRSIWCGLTLCVAQGLTSFEPGQRLKARLLAVNPTTKRAALSLQPHLLNFTITPDLPPVSLISHEGLITLLINKSVIFMCCAHQRHPAISILARALVRPVGATSSSTATEFCCSLAINLHIKDGTCGDRRWGSWWKTHWSSELMVTLGCCSSFLPATT